MRILPIEKGVKLGAYLSGAAFVLGVGCVQAAEIEEVIVTAQHREENLQDVPVSVTAFSGEMMAEADIRGATEVALFSPGMSYAEFAPGQALIGMRGIISADDGPAMDNSVSAFLDGVYIGRPANINFDLYDIERIEVLRGPQGTLFGRNAVGGAINIVTAKPTDEFDLKGTLSVGNEGHLKYEGLVSGALRDNFFGKLSYSHNEHDGYIRNIVLDKDQMDADKDTARVQLVWQATDTSEFILSVDIMEDDREDMGRTPVAGPLLTNFAIAQGGGPSNPRKAVSPIDGGSEREAQGLGLTANFDLGVGTLTSITGWRNSETDWQMASAGVSGRFGPSTDLIDDIQEDIDQVSQELRWTSQLEGIFNFVAGLYFLQEETDRTESFRIYASEPSLLEVGRSTTNQDNETESIAAYGQGTWDFTDTFSLSVGMRYTSERKDVDSLNIRCGDDPMTLPAALAAQQAAICGVVTSNGGILLESFDVNTTGNWEDFSPKIAVDWTPADDLMFFASIAKGFKSGGIGGSPPIEAAVTEIDPEQVWNYEIGMKGDFFDNSLRLNLTGFYMDYDDLQVVRFGAIQGSGSPVQVFATLNLGQADISGAEMEFIWAATENLQLSGNYAYLESEVSEFNLGTADVSGTVLRQAPKNTSALTLNYDYPTDAGTFKVRIDYVYSDNQSSDFINKQADIDQFELWNGRLAWLSSDEQWEVALWGKNLLDEDYISHSYNFGGGGSAVGIWGAPATYGVAVNWNYLP